MNVTIATTHRTLARAKISARHVNERLAERGSSRLIANKLGKDICLCQKHSASDPDRFLALAKVNAAGDLAAAIETDKLFFKHAREQHPAICFEVALVLRGLLSL